MLLVQNVSTMNLQLSSAFSEKYGPVQKASAANTTVLLPAEREYRLSTACLVAGRPPGSAG